MKTVAKKNRLSVSGRLFDVVRSVDIITVLVHLTLITAGAFIALFLSNLQEKRKEIIKEVSMLQQLHQSLSVDIQNLERFANYRKTTLNETKALRKFLLGKEPWNDSISILFYDLSATGLFYPHPGAFESLKSTGIDLIHNPDICFGLFTTYEENFKSLNKQEENYEAMLNQYWLPYISERILLDSTSNSLRPIYFEMLRRDPRLLNLIGVFSITNNVIYTTTRHSIVDASLLEKQIEFELEQIQKGKQDDDDLCEVTITLKGHTDAKLVTVAGTFNSWNANADKMMKSSEGWNSNIRLKPGCYMYKFVVDDVWIDDPGNNQRIQNEYDNYNSFLKVQ